MITTRNRAQGDGELIVRNARTTTVERETGATDPCCAARPIGAAHAAAISAAE